MMRFLVWSLLGVLQGFVAGRSLADVSTIEGHKSPVYPITTSGTVIGNAKFVEYSNAIYGLELMYPEQWNLVDTGQSVNIVAYEPEANARNQIVGLELPPSIDLYFDDRLKFDSFSAFDRHVKSSEPRLAWSRVYFKGLSGFRFDTKSDARLLLLRPDKTSMHVSFPLEDGKVPILVERTIESIVFR